MKLDIPKPCPEKWENMLPNETGAFCNVCNKNVIDFTKKSKSEIKEFFRKKESTEKTCGKISGMQILEMSFGGFFQRFRLWNLTRKIAVVIYFVFGFGLFSCGGDQVSGEMIEEPMGKVAYEDTLKPGTDTSALNPEGTDTLGQVAKIKKEETVKPAK